MFPQSFHSVAGLPIPSVAVAAGWGCSAEVGTGADPVVSGAGGTCVADSGRAPKYFCFGACHSPR